MQSPHQPDCQKRVCPNNLGKRPPHLVDAERVSTLLALPYIFVENLHALGSVRSFIEKLAGRCRCAHHIRPRLAVGFSQKTVLLERCGGGLCILARIFLDLSIYRQPRKVRVQRRRNNSIEATGDSVCGAGEFIDERSAASSRNHPIIARGGFPPEAISQPGRENVIESQQRNPISNLTNFIVGSEEACVIQV